MAKVPMTADDFRKEIENLKVLRNYFGNALKGEEDAVKRYSETARMADRVDPQLFGRKVSEIKNQELQHAESFRRMIQTVDKTITMTEGLIKKLKQFETEKVPHGR